MSTRDLIDHVTQDLTDWYSDFTLDELKDTIGIDDEGLFEELVDNITNTDPIVYNNGGKS